MKDNTILYLAGGGAALFLLYKTDFLGLKAVGEGIGTAAEGGGTFVKETFVQGGETIRDVGQLIQTTTQGGEKIIYQTGEQASRIIEQVGGIGTDILSENTGLRGIAQNIGGLGVDTSGFLREFVGNTADEILQKQERLFSLDDKIISGAKNIFSYVPAVVANAVGVLSGGSVGAIGGIASPVNLIIGGASEVAKKAAGYLKTEPVSGGSVTLSTSSSSIISKAKSLLSSVRSKISSWF